MFGFKNEYFNDTNNKNKAKTKNESLEEKSPLLLRAGSSSYDLLSVTSTTDEDLSQVHFLSSPSSSQHATTTAASTSSSAASRAATTNKDTDGSSDTIKSIQMTKRNNHHDEKSIMTLDKPSEKVTAAEEAGTTTTTTNRRFILMGGRCTTTGNSVGQTISNQIYGMCSNSGFYENGLPWKGDQCRSLWAGGTGILFSVPGIICLSKWVTTIQQQQQQGQQQQLQVPPLFGILLLFQGPVSVMADYFHVHHNSIWHGIDRYLAITNFISIVYSVLHKSYKAKNATIATAAAKTTTLTATTVIDTDIFAINGNRTIIVLLSLLATIPIGCYIMASQSKTKKNLQNWHLYHGLWHVTGSSLSSFVSYLLYYCP